MNQNNRSMSSFKISYDESKLKNDIKINSGRNYQQCSVSVMDTIADPDITFDEKGISNYYYEYHEAVKKNVYQGEAGVNELNKLIGKIKSGKGNKKYDCILGLSGGIDSTYLAYLAKQQGLNPLTVHFDYGWNSEIAVRNIEKTTQILNYDLYTHVMDWPEFRDVLRSYFKAGVMDLDVPADHMIFGALYKIAKKHGIKYILSGNNVVTEHTLPKAWSYNKFDWVNMTNIQKQFGTLKLKKLPRLGYWDILFNTWVKGIERIQLLNCIPYDKNEVKKTIINELSWTDYGGKHQESVFTRFYQGYILPNRFSIDKRKAHLSTLIFAGQISKEQALKELSEPPYSVDLQKEDYEYVSKKLGFTDKEFNEVLTQPLKEHSYYGTDEGQRKMYMNMTKFYRKIFRK